MGRRTKKNPEVTLGRRQRRRKEQRRKNVREVISTILYLAILCAAVYFILHYVGQRTVVRGDSMDTTLSDGQNLIMDKLSYHFRNPERYDIVIFPGPEEYGEHPYYIKRVIGLPGETVQIKKGKVYINGKKLKSDIYGITKYIDEPGIAEEPLELGKDEYFYLGDNRPVSYDSRYEEVGSVHRSEIIGKVWIRIWPLTKFGKVS